MISFEPSRWENIIEVSDRFFNHELNRPMAGAVVSCRDPGRPCPDVPLLSQATCLDWSYTPEQLIDRIDYEMSSYEYYGDAYPLLNLDSFGPGVIAAFIGAEIENITKNVWFTPKEIKPLSELSFSFNRESPVYQRILSIYRAAANRWEGQVLLGMPDLGGIADILSTFRPNTLLPMDFYDEPKQVKRLLWNLTKVWHEFYADIASVIHGANPGFSDWSGIFSKSSFYILQSDFSYMISPEMFREFILPGLTYDCDQLEHSFYHLDGEGQLAHLDMLLDINLLDGIQWVPGDGKKPCEDYPEVYRRILDAGKLVQFGWRPFDAFDKLLTHLGSNGTGFMIPSVGANAATKQAALDALKHLKVL